MSSMRSGGAERVMSIMANDMVEKGNEVHLFLLERSIPFYFLDNRINIHFVDLEFKKEYNNLQKGILLIKKINEIRKSFKKLSIQVIISFGLATNLYSILLSKITNIPVIISERTNPQIYSVSKLFSTLRKRTYKRANAIVLQTKETEKICRSLNLILPSKIVIIENPINIDNKNININNKEKIIISIGRLQEEKGHELLIRAVSNIDLKDWEVRIIGGGVLKEKLQNLILKLKLENKVFLLDKKKNVQPYLEKSSIFVLTSLFEGFPNALCEAMILGNASISFDCKTGPKEIIDNRVNGVLVPLNNVLILEQEIITLINNKEKRDSLGKNAMLLSNRLSVSTIMNKWYHLIDEIIV